MKYLIALEGIDGSGKTTTAQSIVEGLLALGVNCKFIDKKYTDYQDADIRYYTQTIKSLIWYDADDPRKFVTDSGWLYFHALWYAMLYENYIKKCKEDILVVDGWFFKIYARFLLKNHFNNDLLQEVYRAVPQCDLVYYLNINPAICFKRRERFSYKEMGGYDFSVTDFQKSYIEFQTKVKEKLEDLSKKNNWINIEIHNESIQEVTAVILNDIKNKLENKI